MPAHILSFSSNNDDEIRELVHFYVYMKMMNKRLLTSEIELD